MYISEKNYQGVLTLYTIVDEGYLVKQSFLYYSKREAYKRFRQYIKSKAYINE